MKFKSARQLNKPRGWIYGAKWAGYPATARVCRVVIGIAPSDWWCVKLTGEERDALEVSMDGRTVYIDNEDGQALAAMLVSMAPLPHFRFMPVFQVMDDPTSQLFYKAKFV